MRSRDIKTKKEFVAAVRYYSGAPENDPPQNVWTAMYNYHCRFPAVPIEQVYSMREVLSD